MESLERFVMLATSSDFTYIERAMLLLLLLLLCVRAVRL
jgi:hypothetical protein